MTRTATITAAGLLIGLTLLAACSTAQSGTAAPTPSSKPAPTSTTPKPTPKPTLPVAANGTDVAACAAGSCEVTVSGPVSIPPAPAFGVAGIAVTAVGSDTVSVSVTFPAGGQSSFDCTAPACDGQFVGPAAGETAGTGSATLQVGGTFTVNQLDLKAVAVLGGSAVLQLS